jgi:hypothetical protein
MVLEQAKCLFLGCHSAFLCYLYGSYTLCTVHYVVKTIKCTLFVVQHYLLVILLNKFEVLSGKLDNSTVEALCRRAILPREVRCSFLLIEQRNNCLIESLSVRGSVWVLVRAKI